MPEAPALNHVGMPHGARLAFASTQVLCCCLSHFLFSTKHQMEFNGRDCVACHTSVTGRARTPATPSLQPGMHGVNVQPCTPYAVEGRVKRLRPRRRGPCSRLQLCVRQTALSAGLRAAGLALIWCGRAWRVHVPHQAAVGHAQACVRLARPAALPAHALRCAFACPGEHPACALETYEHRRCPSRPRPCVSCVGAAPCALLRGMARVCRCLASCQWQRPGLHWLCLQRWVLPSWLWCARRPTRGSLRQGSS
jgi:hypothetical protein